MQGVNLIAIRESLGHAHIDVISDVYPHIRLQRDAVDTLGRTLGGPGVDPDGPPATAVVR
jgi:hypothetical protein